jgi:EAL domain-containing protein (putative c-di-GMP-specific phosphodiesterase class I)
MESIPQTRKANLVAQKVLQCFEAPFEFDGMQFYVTVSLGMTVCNSTVLNADEIIRQADTAMYRAKEVKGNSKYLYDSVLNNEVIRKIELEHEAREALQNDDFYLALQPIIDMKTNYLYGFEALLRWRHPEKGLISPAEFIPILENSSFMLNLDYYVIERSMRVLRYLTTLGYKEQSVAINLSATQFLDPNLKKFLQKMLKKYDIAAHRIELELTETTLVSDTKMTARVMHDLRKVGVKISIDDFGTGYSSLSYLSSMPVSKIKIDRTFVNGLLENSTDSQIVTSTIAMVKNIGMKVVAEGIETIDQYAKLRDLHCDFAQGYFISRPIPEHQLEKGLSEILIEKVWNPSIEHSMGLKYFN